MPRGKLPQEDLHVKQSVSFEPAQLKRVIAYCEREERTLSWVIRKALAEWLEKHDQQ